MLAADQKRRFKHFGNHVITCMLPENTSAQAGWTCLTPEAKSSTPEEKIGECITTVSSEFIPDPQDAVKTIHIHFHVMQSEAPFDKENFDETNQDHVAYPHQIFTRLESLYTASAEKYCNGQNQGFLSHTNTRIRFQLEGSSR